MGTPHKTGGGGKGRSGDPSVKAQVEAHRTSKGTRDARATGLGNRAAAKAYNARAKGDHATANIHHMRANRLHEFGRENYNLAARRQHDMATRTLPKAVKGGLTQVARNLTAKHMRNLRASA